MRLGCAKDCRETAVPGDLLAKSSMGVTQKIRYLTIEAKEILGIRAQSMAYERRLKCNF